MRDAERVTFGGSGLDRAAELRPDGPGLAAAWAQPATRCIALWHGKVLWAGSRLLPLPATHPALAGATGPVLLGRDEKGLIFAASLADWPGAEMPDGGFIDKSEQRHPAIEDGVFVELRGILPLLSPRDAELAATAKAVLGWHESHGFCARCGGPTDLSDGGWQRRCPGCSATHFPRTDPVVIMAVTHGDRLLLGRSHQWPEGMYSLLAGFIEPGETVEAAVRREVMEESGIRIGQVDYLASQPWPFPASLMIGCRADALNTDINIDPAEIEEAFWIRRDELAQVMTGAHSKVRPARAGSIAHFLMWHWLADRLE